MKAYDKGGNDFQQIPAGTHVARCVRLIDLGTQWNEMYQIDRHQIYIGFEVPSERMKWKDDNGEHEGPFVVGGFYTLSLNEKSKLRPLLASWRGRDFTEVELAGFEMKNILDKTCMLNVLQEDKGGKKRSKIASIMPLPKGMTCSERENDLLFFSLDEYSSTEFEKVPAGYQKIIKDSHEWKQIHGENGAPVAAPKPDFDDDIPF
jgi:hypothetical protein